MKGRFSLLLLFAIISINLFGQKEALNIGIIGLTHAHVGWVFDSEKRGDITIAGIVEPNMELARRYSEQNHFSMDIVYPTLAAFLEAKQPIAVAGFGDIYGHLEIVEACAPLGIHVMVEKPLAVNLEHARKMEALAKRHEIHLLTNYETTWYPTNHKAYELLNTERRIGDIRKVVVRDGHRGPKKIGVSQEFLDWLADPVLNGGGAVIDFGCYGANLLTWLMNGERPSKVTALTQQFQAENNPKVDDEAIILLTYENSNAIIQASWNWPIGRKDMEIYGLTGAIYSDNRHDLRLRLPVGYDGFTEEKMKLEERPVPYNDPFVFFSAVINDEIVLAPFDLSSLENNMLVTEILDAAIRSANSNQSVILKD